ncbi:MAG: FAD-dependent oxidoreductase [Helicobacteraceae bacterium]|jgi:formate dehydrogenase beta subunit|nr:FAD-dependent oxidoreductase [Helicobacteraceae bacterium]
MVKPWFSSWRGAIVDNRGKPSEEYAATALKLPIAFDENRAIRAFIGWDGVAIFDEKVDVARLAARYALQYQNYSQACGRCAPGRAGGRILYDLLDKIARGEGETADLARLKSACAIMRSSAKCEIGRTAPKAISQLIEHFPQPFHECIDSRKQSAEYDRDLFVAAKIAAPCSDACPDLVDIPAYIEALKDRQPLKSVEETRKTMPLARVCGRVCPRPCEDSCRRSHFDEPIGIMELKRVGADYEDRRGARCVHFASKSPPIGKKVAIVGAGPAGLSAAYYLSLSGVECDIFEALPVAGGEVMVGVPEYRMPSEKYLTDIRFIESSGARIHLNSSIDAEKLLELEKNYDAILLSFGARLSKKLRCENENESIDGYWGAIGFLDRVNLWEKFKIGSPVDFRGKTVVCAGGGFTSMDVVRCAVRAGAKKAIMLYRRSERVIIQNTSEEEYQEAKEEGVEFIFRAAIAKIVDENGVVKKVVCNRFEMFEDPNGGRPQLTKIEGQDFEIECDYVIPAVSQEPDLTILPAEWNIELTSWGTIKTDGKTFAANKIGVFSAGDCEYGPMTIVNAVGQARRAASVMLNYLKTGEIKRSDDEIMEDLLRGFRVFDKNEKPTGYLGGFARERSKKLSADIRKTSVAEVNLGLTPEAAFKEANRCMRCYYIALAELNG